jgi:hypothetical protein
MFDDFNVRLFFALIYHKIDFFAIKPIIACFCEDYEEIKKELK